MALSRSDLDVKSVEDKPATGMWHCGPNNCWLRITHKPTGISVTAYGERDHKVRRDALAALELLVEAAEGLEPRFLERASTLSQENT